MQQFKERLQKELLRPLPAHQAHQKVMGHRRAIHQLEGISENAKQSSVLILIYPKEEQLHTVFILRPIYQGVHSAQIGFPGGKIEESDEDLEATALREANEELDIQPSHIEVLGKLTPIYVPPSNFLINPFVAFQDTTPVFIPDEREVEEVLESPLINLIGEDKLISTRVNVSSGELRTKGFALNDKIIWGATGMILKEFAEILERIKPPTLLR